MEKRNLGIIATIATIFLCALPGACLCLFGVVTATGLMPYSTEFNGILEEGMLPGWVGYALLCLAVLLVLVPVVVGYFTLRKPAAKPPLSDEPIPPPL